MGGGVDLASCSTSSRGVDLRRGHGGVPEQFLDDPHSPHTPSSRSVASETRSVCGETPSQPARSAAA